MRLVDVYRSLAETLIWGDKHDPRILEYKSLIIKT